MSPPLLYSARLDCPEPTAPRLPFQQELRLDRPAVVYAGHVESEHLMKQPHELAEISQFRKAFSGYPRPTSFDLLLDIGAQLPVVEPDSALRIEQLLVRLDQPVVEQAQHLLQRTFVNSLFPAHPQQQAEVQRNHRDGCGGLG